MASVLASTSERGDTDPIVRPQLVTHADKYLLKWEEEHRIASERWRNVARAGERLRRVSAAYEPNADPVAVAELASQGTIPSETTMRKWKERKDKEAQAMDLPQAAPVASPVLEELKKTKEAATTS